MKTIKVMVEVKVCDDDVNESDIAKIVERCVIFGIEEIDPEDSCIEEAIDDIISIEAKAV